MNEPTVHADGAIAPSKDHERNDQPIFQTVFGVAWEELSPVLRRHYANRPRSADRLTVKGQLDVMCRGPIRLLRPLFQSLHLIPRFNEAQVPVTVVYESHADSRDFSLNRTFLFANRFPAR